MARRAEDAGDEELLGLLRAGDEHAFTHLVETYQGRIAAFLRRMLPRGADVEDAAQAVFTRAWLGMGKFRGEVSLESWLYRIARNHAIDRLRKKRARPETPWAGLSEEQENLMHEHTAAETADPGEQFLEDERARRAWELLESLKPEDRSLLVLKEIEGKSLEDISKIVGKRVGAIKVRISRARKKLREQLAAMEREA